MRATDSLRQLVLQGSIRLMCLPQLFSTYQTNLPQTALQTKTPTVSPILRIVLQILEVECDLCSLDLGTSLWPPRLVSWSVKPALTHLCSFCSKHISAFSNWTRLTSPISHTSSCSSVDLCQFLARTCWTITRGIEP
ncbi:hypothetical protein MT325_m251R [Paramecium bursaria chlorella virus MT325]|uniref:Uncharacterized protein m251R n=1 Tax=Paramecium bursaria Chlorella virus MT325 TaxID=346932 RepID=A7ITY1_PBCVM|nr:hypothetical protein MT325_m251R [Paramecium bursaria chlorella virus MT325]